MRRTGLLLLPRLPLHLSDEDEGASILFRRRTLGQWKSGSTSAIFEVKRYPMVCILCTELSNGLPLRQISISSNFLIQHVPSSSINIRVVPLGHHDSRFHADVAFRGNFEQCSPSARSFQIGITGIGS